LVEDKQGINFFNGDLSDTLAGEWRIIQDPALRLAIESERQRVLWVTGIK
jgi:hypothetical protein